MTVSKLTPILRSELLPAKARTGILETFIEPLFLYGSSTFMHYKVDNNRLKAIQDSAQKLMLRLYSMKRISN